MVRMLKDRLRLALRKALPRLIAFACMPTQQELERLVLAVLQSQFHPIGQGDSARPADRPTLH